MQTKSYVYHPAFLSIELGGGPQLVQGEYESGQVRNRGNDVLFNFDAELHFLERKTYPFTLFLRQDHPEVTTGVLGRYLSKMNEFGARGTLRPKFLPSLLIWNAATRTMTGSGFDSTLDESTDRASVRTSIPYGTGQSVGITIDLSERESASGSAGLPIQESLIKTVSTRLDGTNAFGANRKTVLRHNLTMLEQETWTDDYNFTKNFGYFGNIRWLGSDRVSWFANYGYKDQERTETTQQSQELGTGVSFAVSDNFRLVGDGGTSRFEDPGLSRSRTSLQGSAQFSTPLRIGKLSLNGTAGVQRTDQESTNDTSRIFDESHVLVGAVPVPLDEQFVIPESVVVTNVPQTQTFVEEIDYRLLTIGSTTTIERIATGNIFDGQEVLVSYEYLTGGTAEYETRTQSIWANFSPFQNADIYARLALADSDIVNGIATTPLNDYKRFEVGGSLNVKLKGGWSMGGDVRYTDNDEDISPSVRTTYDIHVQSGRYWGITARFGLYMQEVDYELSIEDVEELRFFVFASGQLGRRSRLTYRYSKGEDDGGSITRENTFHRMQFDWRYRRVMVSVRADRSEVSQGLNRTADTHVTAELRRRF